MVELLIAYNGTKWWSLNGTYHRANGPAIIESHGDYFWYWYGQRHRVDGPAVYQKYGSIMWFWHGKKVNEYEHMMLDNTIYNTEMHNNEV